MQQTTTQCLSFWPGSWTHTSRAQGWRNGHTMIIIYGVYQSCFFFCHSWYVFLWRCLAHIINLATQAILKAHSSSKHYDPNEPSAHEPNVDDVFRDEIGLVRSIVVKVTYWSILFNKLLTDASFRLAPQPNVASCSKTFRPEAAKQPYGSFWTWLYDGHQRISCSIEQRSLRRSIQY